MAKAIEYTKVCFKIGLGHFFTMSISSKGPEFDLSSFNARLLLRRLFFLSNEVLNKYATSISTLFLEIIQNSIIPSFSG